MPPNVGLKTYFDKDFNPLAPTISVADFKPMTKKSFLDRLRTRIDADPDLTEAGLSVAAGLDKTTIRQMFAHRRNPRVDTMEKICAALGTSLEEFMSDARSEEDRRILRLVSQLTLAERLQLLGYGEALIAQRDPAPPKDQ